MKNILKIWKITIKNQKGKKYNNNSIKNIAKY